MTNQEKASFLRRYIRLEEQIRRKENELQRWRIRASNISPTYSDMPRGGVKSDRIQSTVEEIISLEQEIGIVIKELVGVRKEIESVIQKVEDDTLKLLLEYRYIDGMTWEQIAVLMSYSYMHVCRLHGKALNKLIM